jgi:hypothetical protein
VPQPGTDPSLQYGGQWPHTSTVNPVNPAMPHTSLATMAPSGQSGLLILSQSQGPLDGGHLSAGQSGHQISTPQDGLALSNRNG